MSNKGKYWILEKNKGVPVSNFEEPKAGIRVSSTGFHSDWSKAVRFVDIIPVVGAKNV